MKTILPTQSKQKYVLDLLKNQSIIGDTDFVLLSVHLNSFYENNRNENWFKAAHELEELSKEGIIRVLGDVLKFPITIDQVSSFIQLMADEGWNLGNLPNETDKEKDLFIVLDELIPVYKSVFRQWIEFDKSDKSKLSILDHFYDYPVSVRLKNPGIKYIEIANKDNVVRKLRYASNPRSEIQAAVQFVVSDNLAYEDQSIVCLDASMMDQVEVFLHQYGVDYQKVGGGIKHPALRLFECIVKFKADSSLENFMHILHNDVIRTKYKLELIKYCEVFSPSIHDLKTELKHIPTAFENNVLKGLVRQADYEILENHAEEALKELRWIIAESEKETLGMVQFVSSCFEIYTKCLDHEDDAQVSALYTIKEFLESSHLENIEKSVHKLDYLLYALDKLSLKEKSKTGLILTDLKHALIPGLKRQIWLGCTQKNYPQIENYSGLFDLDYLLKVKGFDLNKRYNYHMEMLKHTQLISDEIIYSYSLGSYEGKAQKMPFELESILKDVDRSSWNLIESEVEKSESEHQLTDTLSQSLMMKSGLKGSITSFENYNHCPYKYFLQRGLNLFEKPSYDLDSALLGNISHALLETAIKEKGKEYASMSEAELKVRIAPYLEAVEALYPNFKEEIKVIEFKLIETLKLSLEFLYDWECHKGYTPNHLEYEFEDEMVLNNGQALKLKGKIDRIDELGESFSVIDYKSSPKSFSENVFVAGLQLQLPTYLWAYLKENRQALFAGYFSQKPERINLSTSEKFNEDETRLKKRLLKGVTFDIDPSFDNDANHINQWKQSEKEGIYTRDAFDASLVLAQLREIYTKIYDDISQGDIHKQNIDNSCKYCDYKHFCQFSGDELKVKKISKKDSKMRKV